MGAPRDDLKLLAIFHYVLAGLTALFALFPLAHVGLGAAMLSGKLDGGSAGPPEAFGWILIVGGLVLAALGETYAVLVAVAGRFLSRQRHWLYCMAMAGLSCAWIPFGTVLGVFTIITLSRDEVKALFGVGAPSAAPRPPQ